MERPTRSVSEARARVWGEVVGCSVEESSGPEAFAAQRGWQCLRRRKDVQSGN